MRYLKYAIKALKPENFYYISSISLKDYLKKYHPAHSNDVHIKAAMDWISTAQSQNNDSGVSALYSLFEGWAPSYVETTGYIISTFFNYFELTNNYFYRKQAIMMADFELRNQLKSGAFPGGSNIAPIVFNTGQVIFGLCRTYKETNNDQYKIAAIKAADWLLSIMDEDGCWRKHTYLNNTHTYNTRTVWSLLQAHEITRNNAYKKAAEKNINWALKQQLKNGWFENNAFHKEQEPLLHTIAYSIRGILEAAIYLRKKAYLESTLKAATPIMEAQRDDGSLPGSFDNNWKSSIKWSCLTGNSQMSIIWQKLFMSTKDQKFLDAAKKINAYMKTTQNLASSNPGIKGGIAGSFPIYGWYAPFSYPNWAAKFFIDSLMLEDNLKLERKLS